MPGRIIPEYSKDEAIYIICLVESFQSTARIKQSNYMPGRIIPEYSKDEAI